MHAPNLSKLLKNFSSGWVALSPDYKKVIASGKTLKELTLKISDQKDKVILISASKNYRGYATTAPKAV